jgi:nicotinamidase-related amidase
VLADGKSAFSDKDDPLTAICPEVAPRDGEALLVKHEADAFGDGRLEPLLRARNVEWIFVTGVWTEACVDATVRHAVALGFRVALVKDACGSGTATMHRAGILNLANRLYGGVVADTTAACRLLAGEPASVWRTEVPVPMRFTLETVDALYRDL